MSYKSTAEGGFFALHSDSLLGNETAYINHMYPHHDLKINRKATRKNEDLEEMDTNFSNQLIDNNGFSDPFGETIYGPNQGTFHTPSLNPFNQNSYLSLTTSDFSCQEDSIDKVERPTGPVNSQVPPVFTPALQETNSETSRFISSTKIENSFEKAEEAYIRLIPLINNLTPKNFDELLVETLRLCLHHISLEDFYILLFVDEEISASNRTDNTRMSQSTIEGLKLCRYIIKTFEFPGVDVGHFAAGLVKKSNFVTISLDHFLRTFLAVKMILDFTEKVELSIIPKNILPRSLIRCAYFVICKKNFHKYKTVSKRSQSNNKVLLKNSQVGRIINVLFKDLTQRRLGRRGESQFYYFGLKWNTNIIDEEMMRLIYREEKMMKSLRESRKVVQLTEKKLDENLKGDGLSVHNSNMSNNLNLEVSEGQTFLGIYNRFLDLICPPHTGKSHPQRLLSLIQWIEPLFLRSKHALCEFAIDLEPLFSTFSLQSGDDNKGFSEVFGFLESFKIQKAPEKVFMHFYLVVALLILPSSLCIRDKFLKKHIFEFQIHLKSFINEMKSKHESLVGWSRKGFSIFSNIIQRIYQIIDLSRLEVKTSAAKDIVAQFARDMSQTALVEQPSGETIKNEAILSAVYQTMKAFDVCHGEQAPETNSAEEVKRILSIEKPFLKFFTRVEQRIRELSSNVTEEDMRRPMCNLALHIFVVLVEEFHQACLPDLEVLELPTHSIPSIFLEISNVYLRITFEDFRKRDVELSKQVFKIFWVWAYMMHEYVRIHSDIMVLAGGIID